MASQAWRVLAGLGGASAVAAGAYGAHGFRPQDPYFTEVYDRANKYHFIHSILLAVAPLGRRPNLVGGLAGAGTLLFSGSCYLVALTEDKSKAKLAPYGGMALIGAWLAFAL